MKKYSLFLLLAMISLVQTFAQTEDELKAAKSAKEDSIKAIQGRVDAIQKQLDAIPGWKVGAFGVIGGSFSEFTNWYAQGSPNNSSGSVGITFNAYANLKQEKFFWRNSLNTNLKWVKFDDRDDDTDEPKFEPTTDVFNLSSLYGRNLSKSWAASALMEYRTTLLDNFNDPGYLDLGVGLTWTPISDLVVVIHPLNYNFVFSSEDVIYESSLGAKIVGDYTKSFGKLNFKSNLSVFLSYEGSDYSNWTWLNSFNYTVWKNFGVGLEIGLRGNKQEALDYAVNTLGETDATFDSIDNKLQSYYTIGLSYNFK
ncbi:DUF3078 domain-containing protein [Aegicerativicinus sediminis]|uniref:DUF3078 domain-containing protein n=1 Tax=Aegicerativicinus sediminis TaxID=2893202 RepID=UPI001E378A73|nr:DUF3078 domain-containing protein [Aegicerativicinus sediminis]